MVRRRRPVLPGLVIGDAQRRLPSLRSTRSIEPRSTKRPSTDRLGHAARIAALVGGQPEANSKRLGRPPAFRLGDSFSRPRRAGRGRSPRSRRATRDRSPARASSRASSATGTTRPSSASARRRRRSRGHRQPPAVAFSIARRTRLDLVEEAAARQRIEPLQRLRLLQRREPVDRRQQELVRAGREALQRRQRVRPRAEPLRRERRDGTPGRRSGRRSVPSATATAPSGR